MTVPSLPEPTELRDERPAHAPGARERHTWLERPRVRALLGLWLADLRQERRRRIPKAGSSARRLADLWNAWAVADVECALSLRAWQLAPRSDKRAPYEAYRSALEREALIAGELRLRIAS
jgi:hypothetical protein